MPSDVRRARHAVVAGAGPGGSVTALLLAASGWQVSLLEHVAAPTAVGAGILLQPNGLAVLAALGLHEPIRVRAHEIRGAAIRNHRDRVLLQTTVPDLGDGLDHLLAVRRSHLATVLADAVTAARAITVHLGAEVVRATPGGTVTYRADAGEQVLDADLVVAADGVRSRVRETAGFTATLHDTGHTYLRAVVPDDGTGTPVSEQTEYWTPLGLFGCSPLGDGTIYFFADAGSERVRRALEHGDAPGVRDAWSEVLPTAAPLVARIGSIDDLLLNEVQRVDAASFHSGRVALLGDAAHAMAPNLGQGANSALVDAAVLAIELSDRADVGAALAAYDARRRPAVRTVQRDADRLARVSGWRSGLARGLRDALIARTPSAASERRFHAVQQEDPPTLRRALAALLSEAPDF